MSQFDPFCDLSEYFSLQNSANIDKFRHVDKSANINIHCFMNILLIIDCGGMGVQGPKCNNVISTTEPM